MGQEVEPITTNRRGFLTRFVGGLASAAALAQKAGTIKAQEATDTTADPTKVVLLETDSESIMQEYTSTNGVVKLINFPDPTDKFLLSPRLQNSLDQIEEIAQRRDFPDQQGRFWPVDGISIILDPNLQTGRGVWGMTRRPPQGVPYDPFADHEYIALIQHLYTYTPEGNRFIELRYNKGTISSPITEEERQNIEEDVSYISIAEDIFMIKSGSPEYNPEFPGINDLPVRTLKRELYDLQPFKVTLTPRVDLTISQ